MDLDKGLINSKCSEAFEWRKWAADIPFIKWPSHYEVKAVPPFAGAVIRYWIKTENCDLVSVYLDCYDQLGFMQKPYWEVYPANGDCERCYLNETDKLLEIISIAGKDEALT